MVNPPGYHNDIALCIISPPLPFLLFNRPDSHPPPQSKTGVIAPSTAQEVFAEADMNNDRRVGYAEFSRMMHSG
jgi:hypothetical protein